MTDKDGEEVSRAPCTRLPVLAIVGPTASGKSALGVAVAARLGGEIVSADSMQVYRGLDIGTAKPTPAERAAVPHHLIDVADPDEPFSAARYQELGRRALADVHGRGRLPVVVGGTGLYVRALLRDYDFTPPGGDAAIRAELTSLAQAGGLPDLRRELERVDPAAAARIHPNDLRRTVRALEVWRLTGRPLSAGWRGGRYLYDALVIGIAMPRDELYGRIDRRVDDMLRQGLVDEVRSLVAQGYGPSLVSGQALGYKEIVEHLAGRLTLAEASDLVKRSTRNYAKRQLTWFRREPGLVWLEAQGTEQSQVALCGQLLSLARAKWENCG